MFRYFAFLRAINVGGHIVKMDQLKQIFESLEFKNVRTTVASGNVTFDDNSSDARVLENKIEDALKSALGYEVVTFIRNENEMVSIVKFQPFPQSKVGKAVSFNVGFLKDRLTPASEKELMSLSTPTDDFAVHGREMYWLCGTKQMESGFSNAVFEKQLAVRSTFRGIPTVQKMLQNTGNDISTIGSK
jgi:uncharacterized protein (DUF1697 family)